METEYVRLRGTLRKINTKIPSKRLKAINQTLKNVGSGKPQDVLMALYGGGFHVKGKNRIKQIKVIEDKFTNIAILNKKLDDRSPQLWKQKEQQIADSINVSKLDTHEEEK